METIPARRRYPGDGSDEEWARSLKQPPGAGIVPRDTPDSIHQYPVSRRIGTHPESAESRPGSMRCGYFVACPTTIRSGNA
jgi:hypothetical protein